MALKALAAIMTKRNWQGKLQELRDDDIKPLVDPFATGEGRRQVSWIWTASIAVTKAIMMVSVLIFDYYLHELMVV
jgi:hypothetical protein